MMKQELSAQTGFSMVSIFFCRCKAVGAVHLPNRSVSGHDQTLIASSHPPPSAISLFLRTPQPERYYQVSREEGHDGRFYSKISAVDWDDL
jgi:hypothetical protein